MKAKATGIWDEQALFYFPFSWIQSWGPNSWGWLERGVSEVAEFWEDEKRLVAKKYDEAKNTLFNSTN